MNIFDDRTEDEISADRLIGDLDQASMFFAADHAGNFRMGKYAAPAEITYWVDNKQDNPAEEFDYRACLIRDKGGSVTDRLNKSDGSIQHIAILPFGSGRVQYRVMWIEREDKPDA